jgi:hypothetical protein
MDLKNIEGEQPGIYRTHVLPTATLLPKMAKMPERGPTLFLGHLRSTPVCNLHSNAAQTASLRAPEPEAVTRPSTLRLACGGEDSTSPGKTLTTRLEARYSPEALSSPRRPEAEGGQDARRRPTLLLTIPRRCWPPSSRSVCHRRSGRHPQQSARAPGNKTGHRSTKSG